MFSGVSKIGYTPFTNSFLVLRPFIRRFATFPFFFLAILYCPFCLGSSLLLLNVACDILSVKGEYIMETTLTTLLSLTLLPPAVIIGVIFWTTNALRNQMQREHDKLWHKVDSLEKLLIEHIKDRNLHN